jgi:PAS domain S-box-containing protein
MQNQATRQARKVALIYISVGGGYILLSNQLVKWLVSDPNTRVNITILKGWIFVLFTGGLLFLTIRRMLRGWAREMAQRTEAETANQAALAKLRESEEQLRFVTNHAPVLIAQCDREQRYQYVNETYADMFGLRPADIVGQHPRAMLGATTYARILPYIEAALGGQSTEVSLTLTTAPGEPRALHAKFAPERDASGQVVGFIAAIVDVTHRERAERALAESQALTRAIIDSTTDLIWSVDTEGFRMQTFNRALAEFFRENRGIPLQAGQRPEDLFASHETEFVERWKSLYRRALQEGPFTTEYATYSGGATLLLSFCALRREEAVFGVSVFGRDITERKLAEARLRAALGEAERFRAAMDEVNACIYMKDAQSRYTYANRPALALFGCTATALAGQEDASFFPAAIAERLRAIDARVLRGQQTVEEVDISDAARGRRVYWEIKTPIYADAARQTVCGLLGISTDITERKLMEETLEHSQRLLAESEKMGKVGSWELDTASGELSWTETVYAIHQQDPAQPPTLKQALDFYTPACRPIIERAVRRAIEAGEPYDLELQIITAKGDRRDVHTIGHAELARHKVFGFFQDITAQKRAEEGLRESQQKFSRMFHSSPIAIALSTLREGRYLDANQEFLALLQRPREEVVGHTALELGVWAYPEQRGAVVGQLTAHGSVRNLEVEIRRRDGEVRRILWSAETVTIGGERCLLGSVLDITERQQAEEQLKWQFSALTATANAIAITNRAGDIKWVNPAFSKLTGYAAEEVIGRNLRLLKSGEHPPAFYAKLWGTVLAGNFWHGEIINKRKDGQLYTEEMNITPVRSADGQIAHFVAIKLDVTERRQLEKRIQQAQKMEAIGTLAGGIAHDFNNMLGAMFGYAHLLQQDTEGNPLAQESVAEILKAANRAKDLVQQILTFSRQREQKPQILQLDVIVKEAIKFLRASLPAHIKIEMNLSAETPAVLADPTQIYQVTMNLVTNALHAMEDRPGQLTVGLEAVEPDTALLHAHPELKPALYARLTVADTGHGMDAKTMERMFEPFFTTKPVGKGTGLGLATVHGIVQAHEGAITVESQVGKGSTFRLYFPARVGAEPAPAHDTTIIHRGQGQRILVLDDEPALTSMLQKALHRMGYQAATSNQAGEAIGMLRENPAGFDLVITDLTMPEMNGLEVAGQLRAIRANLPIILVSGYSVSVDGERLQAAGICERLDKPVSLATLGGVVERALQRGAT